MKHDARRTILVRWFVTAQQVQLNSVAGIAHQRLIRKTARIAVCALGFVGTVHLPLPIMAGSKGRV